MEGEYNREPPHRYEGICAAEALFDMDQIELEALMLIEQGGDRPEVPVYRAERKDNARTLLMEALTASGHLSAVKLEGKSIDEIHEQVLDRLLNGWDDKLPQHECKRRFYEICEELVIYYTHKAIERGELPPDTKVGLISDFPDELGEQAPGLGYRPYNRKGMVRTAGLQRSPGGYTRVIEQLSRSNSGVDTTFPFLQGASLQLDETIEPDIAALRLPFLFRTHDYAAGVIDIQRRLDAYAGSNVCYGDEVGSNPMHVPYELLRHESAWREEQIEDYVTKLADLEEQLDQMVTTGLDKTEASQIYLEQVDRILAAICTLIPDYAEDTYGEAAAPYFYEAALLCAQGRYIEAQQLLGDTEHTRHTVTFCGASISVEKAKEMGLKVNSFGELVEEGKNKITFNKIGFCRVMSCPSRQPKPKMTRVGPCSVCRSCQALFKRGIDPTKQVPKQIDGPGKRTLGGAWKEIIQNNRKLNKELDQIAESSNYKKDNFTLVA